MKKIKNNDSNDQSIVRFCQYLRIKSMQPDPDYPSIMKFLKSQADEIGLEFKSMEFFPQRPIAIMTLKGNDPTLPSVLLHSHTDVVSVFPEQWKYDPFGAVIADNGNIYARGSQDMKGTGIQYLEAIRAIKKDGTTLLRTIHVIYVPDEEIGGQKGMDALAQSQYFKDLKVCVVLGEGRASPTQEFYVHYAERAVRTVLVTITGSSGHASRFIENSAVSKFQKLLISCMEYREQERKRLITDSELTLGDVTTINLTQLKAGVAFNVVPSEIYCTFDMRVTPRVDLSDFENLWKSWVDAAGDGITYKFHQRSCKPIMSSIEPGFVWWDAISRVAKKMDLALKPCITGGATDSRFLREKVKRCGCGLVPSKLIASEASLPENYIRNRMFDFQYFQAMYFTRYAI
ncbi:aminoacylase-1-like isoform X2 [Gordionus sp. m RMFG-2023]|uniref:aminoacylase-1-like isoform X2 n=1 Tax=Gordionus sp. m RMFG-2023 TaxID=3053472 RepID=UPI0031FBBD99